MTQQDVIWTPHPRQRLFLANPSYEALYGGAAGGGKSDALLFGGLRYIHMKGYAALILRRSFPELKELMDRSFETFPALGGHWSGDDKRWTFPSQATFEMGYCERYEDIMRYQGRQFAYIAWDELAQVPEERMWTKLMAWNRTPVPGITKMMRASANPGGPGHAWIRKRFISCCDSDGEPYLDPTTGFTRAFVSSTVRDNPTIMENDPQYVRQLELLPETLKRQLLYGDWDAGTGMALEELNEKMHLVRPFPIPDHWVMFASYDWGFRHRFSFGIYAADEDGNIYKVETISGHRMITRAQIQHIREMTPVPLERLAYIVAGHDVFAKHSARGGSDPTDAEIWMDEGLVLSRANIDRIAGLNNFREYIAWRGRGPNGTHDRPRFMLFDTPGNRECFEQLESIVMNEKKPEDSLKVDADEQGKGGDDMYDETRYALASRPARGASNFETFRGAWSPEALKWERDKNQTVPADPELEDYGHLSHDEFGEIF